LKLKGGSKWVLIGVAVIIGMYLAVGILNSQSAPTMKHSEPIYQGDSDKKRIALICNVVWGEEHLPDMLETLKENEAKMTFFIGGQWAEKFPNLVKKINKEGHDIGNHGYAHLHPNQISTSKNLDEIKKTEDILYDLIGERTNLFHPPYREINSEVARAVSEKEYKTIMSSVDTIDWERPPAEVIIDRVITKAHNGAIVLMHPTQPTKEALGDIIIKLKEQGYEIVTISQLLSDENKKDKLDDSNPEHKFNKDVGSQ